MKPDIHARATPAPTHKKESWRERDQLIEIIAIFKFVKVAGLLGISFGIINLLQPATALRLQNWIIALSSGASHPHILKALVMVSSYSPRRIQALGVIVLFYATLYMIEGIGLADAFANGALIGLRRHGQRDALDLQLDVVSGRAADRSVGHELVDVTFCDRNLMTEFPPHDFAP